MRAVFDTNILIDYLNGLDQARGELALYDRPMISPITWIEVVVGGRSDMDPVLLAFLRRFEQAPLDTAVAERAVRLRRSHRLKVPDAIIWATAQSVDALLVTRNTKDFPTTAPDVRVPYTV